MIWPLLVMAAVVENQFCPDGCMNNGACYELFEKDTLQNDTFVPIYICECHDGFVGLNCAECTEFRFGPKCSICPHGYGKVCGGRGVCDSGIHGTGRCFCEDSYTSESNCTEEYTIFTHWHELNARISLVFLASILCVLSVYSFINYPKLHIFPDSVASILLGLAVGAVFSYVSYEQAKANFLDPQSFFLIIIPPIMYDAGYSSDKQHFFKNLGSILVFAVLGTMLSAFVFGMLMFVISLFLEDSTLSLVDCLVFGSLISAVDPVATMAVFEAMQVDRTLHAIVFGESVLNDAIAIALFNTFNSVSKDYSDMDISYPFLVFFYVFFGSILVGTLLGLLNALIFRVFRLNQHPTLETAMFFLWSYMPFVLCEGLGMSGILGVLFMGMVNSHYTHYSLSKESRVTTHQTYRTAAFIAENVCFAYLGLSLPLIVEHVMWPLVYAGIIVLLISRAVAVFPLSSLCNSFRSEKISFKHQFVIWFSGMRGAVAFALALSVPSPSQKIIVTTTLLIILFTIFCLGVGTKPLLKCLKLELKDIAITRHGESIHRSKSQISQISQFATQAPAGGVSSPAPSKRSFFEWIKEFDKEYLQRYFIRADDSERLE